MLQSILNRGVVAGGNRGPECPGPEQGAGAHDDAKSPPPISPTPPQWLRYRGPIVFSICRAQNSLRRPCFLAASRQTCWNFLFSCSSFLPPSSHRLQTCFHSGQALVSRQLWFSEQTVSVPVSPGVPASASHRRGEGFPPPLSHDLWPQSDVPFKKKQEISTGSTALCLMSTIKEAGFKQLNFRWNSWLQSCRELWGRFQIYHPRLIIHVWLFVSLLCCAGLEIKCLIYQPGV